MHDLPPSSALIHPIYARLLRMLLQQVTQDGDRVLAAAGLRWDRLLADDRRLGLDTVARLATAAVAATQRPWLGLDLGGQAPVSAHGPLGYAVVTARDLGQGLALLARFGATRDDSMAWSWAEDHAGVVLRGVERVAWGPARGFVLDTLVGALLRVIETALGELPPGLRLDLPLPAPAWLAQYRRFDPVEFRFGQPVLALHVHRDTLHWPCLGADAKAHAAAVRDCEAALAELTGTRLSQQVAGLLASVPDGHWPALDEVAQRCGVSPRTLMRRLQADGASFQGLLDAARQARALWLLQHTAVPVDEIAHRLGYEDTSNFSRTVRRWFGQTPRALRQAGRGP